MENSIRLELFCRLFLGLFVGFFCVTAVLFVRYESTNPPSDGSFKHSNSVLHDLSGSTAAVPLSSASSSQSARPVLDAEQTTLITSSTSTLVTFIAAVVVHFMSWRNRKRRGRRAKIGHLPHAS